MRYRLTLLVLGALVAGCSSNHASAPKPTATSNGLARIETIPTTTPPPVKGGRPVVKAKAGSAPGVKALPTPKSVTFATPTPFPASDYTAAIEGTVIDAKSHTPLSGALVTVGTSHVTRTNSFGHYRISFPAGPPVPVQVTMQGFAGELAMGSIRPHKAITLNFKLTPIIAGHPVAPPAPVFFGNR